MIKFLAAISQTSYLKAFTLGSCKNICGKESIDCSCSQTCIYQGNCCSDYLECEELLLTNFNKKLECQSGNQNCELCESFLHKEDLNLPGSLLPLKCGKCKEGFFLSYGECVPKCSITDKILFPNKICISTQKCLVENCYNCFDKNPSLCKYCTGGFFLLNNQCYNNCPLNFKADRMTMTCVENKKYAWYWVFPSKHSCKDSCLIDFSKYPNADCKCDPECLRRGDCCQDVDEYCKVIPLNI